MTETCDCTNCFDNEAPCHFDCSFDELCEGCYLSMTIEAEEQFFQDLAVGRY